ncbi:MAG TPA: hypothetical protein VLY63_12700 [Anaerolineae bacterium]|nr:hypothetical protein [Anaerolineae bacterium]
MSLQKSVQAGIFTVAVLLIATDLLAASDLPGPKDQPLGPASQSATASRMGPEIQISWTTSPEANRFAPAVAYNWRHREYLVLWHNTWPGDHRDIYARRVSETGRLLSGFAVSAGPNDRAQPAVAYNATNDEYLVTWMYNANGDGSTYEIWGRVVAWNGSYMGAEKQIITYPNRTFWTPRVAWNSFRNQYLVVWSAHETGTLTPTDVAHALLSANGDKLFGTIISSDEQPHQADVAYNVASDEYLVVWRRMWAPADGDIRAARVAGSSAVVINPPGVFTISGPTEDQLLPSVTTNQQHRYLVVWQHAFPGPCCDWDIRGQELDVNGGLVGSELHFATSFDDEMDPRVAARPGPTREYLVVWRRATTAGEAVRGIWWNGATSRSLDLATIAFWDAESPAVAAGSPGFLTVYEGDAQGDPTVYRHIYGRRWTPNAVLLPMAFHDW